MSMVVVKVTEQDGSPGAADRLHPLSSPPVTESGQIKILIHQESDSRRDVLCRMSLGSSIERRC